MTLVEKIEKQIENCGSKEQREFKVEPLTLEEYWERNNKVFCEYAVKKEVTITEDLRLYSHGHWVLALKPEIYHNLLQKMGLKPKRSPANVWYAEINIEGIEFKVLLDKKCSDVFTREYAGFYK